jgi:murein DD-endopeptidase MepM/ murein hydrolase activator NlpD
MAAAGVGAHRSVSVPQLTSSLPARFAVTVVAGGALAAAGQYALIEALPIAANGANVLQLGVEELLGGAPQAAAAAAVPDSTPAPLVAEPPAPVAAVAAEPVVADAATLVKAAGLQKAAADAAAAEAAQAAAAHAAAAQAAAAQAAPAVEAAAQPAQAVVAAADGAVQMIVGQVTSGFGSRWGTLHEGVDIAAPIGTPIHAPLAGTVIDSGPASGFGLWVRVRHADGTISIYGHINRSLVSVGQQVAAGQEIAEVGNRGQSTGPHLHFGLITPAGNTVDPQPWLNEHGIRF